MVNGLLKYGISLVVASLVIAYFLEIVYLFGLFIGVSSGVLGLFTCVGVDYSVVETSVNILSLGILFLLVYFFYEKFFK